MAYGVCDNLGDMWLVNNSVDAATLSGASASPSLDVSRLKDPRLGKMWRTPVGGATLLMQWATAVPLQVFGVFALRPLVGLTMTLRIGTTIGGAEIRTGAWAPTISPYTAQGFWLNAVERPGLAAPMVREIALGLTHATQAVDLGRVWAGDYHWTPTVSQTFGSDQGAVDMSAVQRTKRGGAVLSDAAKVQRTASIRYDGIPQDELDDEVFSLTALTGLSKQLLFVPNYKVFAPTRHAILGHQEEMNPIASLAFDRYTKAFTLREDG